MHPPLLQHAASLSQPSGLSLLYSKEAFECDDWADRRSHPKHANNKIRQNQALHACMRGSCSEEWDGWGFISRLVPPLSLTPHAI